MSASFQSAAPSECLRCKDASVAVEPIVVMQRRPRVLVRVTDTHLIVHIVHVVHSTNRAGYIADTARPDRNVGKGVRRPKHRLGRDPLRVGRATIIGESSAKAD